MNSAFRWITEYKLEPWTQDMNGSVDNSNVQSEYEKFFHHLLYTEELQLEEDMKTYNLRRAAIKRAGSRTGEMRFKITVS